MPVPILSISSNKINGLALPASLNAFTILPGIAPTYVLLWPLISDSSVTPPNEILTYFLLSASAIECAILVLPVPGGPTKHIIGLTFFAIVNCLTAKNSNIRSFTFFNS